jgi:hypothetical protein
MRQGAGGAAALLLAGIFVLGGCTSMRLHDEMRAKLATETKEQYSKADVAGILDVEAKNLDLLLAESIKVSRDNHKLQLDLALLSIAADETPMAGTVKEINGRLKVLGFDTSKGPEGAYKYLDILTERKRAVIAMEDQRAAVRALSKKEAPQCTAESAKLTFEQWSGEKAGDPAKPSPAKRVFTNYIEACKQFLQKPVASGEIERVSTRIEQEALQLRAIQLRVKEEEGKLKTARTAYQTAADATSTSLARCAEREKGLSADAQKQLENLQKTLSAADKLSLSISNDERIKELLVLLEAAAGGKVDPADPNLKVAARVGQELPSLWGDMCELLASGKAPPVGNLLLALRHTTLLSEYARNQAALARARIALLEEKQAALRDEAVQWVNMSHAICRFAALSMKMNEKDEGGRCGNFTVSPDGKICSLNGSPFATSCVTSKSWAANFQATAAGPAKRELYKAMLAYQRAFALQSRVSEIDFEVIDVLHRETLARKRFAVQDWDALVGGAVAQLDAYYASGLKPAEVADLIVKSLGFIAITVGVSQ